MVLARDLERSLLNAVRSSSEPCHERPYRLLHRGTQTGDYPRHRPKWCAISVLSGTFEILTTVRYWGCPTSDHQGPPRRFGGSGVRVLWSQGPLESGP